MPDNETDTTEEPVPDSVLNRLVSLYYVAPTNRELTNRREDEESEKAETSEHSS